MPPPPLLLRLLSRLRLLVPLPSYPQTHPPHTPHPHPHPPPPSPSLACPEEGDATRRRAGTRPARARRRRRVCAFRSIDDLLQQRVEQAGHQRVLQLHVHPCCQR